MSALDVLVGVPPAFPDAAAQKFEILLANCYPGDVVRCNFVRDTNHFLDEYNRVDKFYPVIVCVDDIACGTSHYASLIGYNLKNLKIIVIVPNDAYGFTQLQDMIDCGFHNIVFQRDMNVANIRTLISQDRTRDMAMYYCGFDLRPVRRDYSPERRERDGSGESDSRPVVQKRYLGNGISVTRLCTQDAKLLKGNDIGEDDVLSELLSGNLDIDPAKDEMKVKDFPIDPEWVDRCKSSLRAYFMKGGHAVFMAYKNSRNSETEEAFEQHLQMELARMNVKGDNAELVKKSFLRDVLSYGKLDILIETPDVTDIRLMNKDVINCQYRGEWYRTNVRFESDSEFTNYIQTMCNKNEKSLNRGNATTVFTDTSTFPGTTLRITTSHAILSTAQTENAHIRISREKKKTVQDLIRDGFWTEKQAAFLISAIRKRKSIVIVGSSGSGKTILLNLLLEYLPSAICGTCVQESDELHSKSHPNIEFQHSISADGEGKLEYTLKDLATKALLKNAEVFIIGEIKGEEAADFFTASRTSIVYTTTHAEDCFGALPRITELAKYKADYSQNDILKILSKNIDYVVYAEKYQIQQIAAVCGWDEKRQDVIYDLYDFNSKEVG